MLAGWGWSGCCLRAGGDGADVGQVESGEAARLGEGGVHHSEIDGKPGDPSNANGAGTAKGGATRGDERDEHGLAGGAEDDATTEAASCGRDAVHEGGRQAQELRVLVEHEHFHLGGIGEDGDRL